MSVRAVSKINIDINVTTDKPFEIGPGGGMYVCTMQYAWNHSICTVQYSTHGTMCTVQYSTHGTAHKPGLLLLLTLIAVLECT